MGLTRRTFMLKFYQNKESIANRAGAGIAQAVLAQKGNYPEKLEPLGERTKGEVF